MEAKMRTALVILMSFAATTLTRQRAMSNYLEAQRYEDIYYLPSPGWLHVLSFGHHEAAASLIWMQALVYVGDEFANSGDVEHAFRYADAILSLDPDFRRAYSWAATAGLYRPSPPSIEDGLRAASYLERGVARFPDDGELAWELSAVYSYELPSLTQDPREKQRYRELGADHMIAAARMGAGPDWLALSNASTLETLGRIDQAVRHLEEMYAIVDDAELREEIATRLEGLRAESLAQALRSTNADLARRAQRDFPWVPTDFYVLLGDRVIARN